MKKKTFKQFEQLVKDVEQHYPVGADMLISMSEEYASNKQVAENWVAKLQGRPPENVKAA